jgi:outer membrane lipoprotein SlyB
MRREILSGILVFLVGLGAILVSGCETKAQSGALLGTAIGVGAGQLIGGNTAGTLIGGAAGAAGGYIIGNEMDKSAQRKATPSTPVEPNTETVWITNTNGSQIPVRLVKDGPAYIGPRGERYPSMPTQDQLRTVYGF